MALLQVSPHPFQEEGINAICSRQQSLMIWDMGTGKGVLSIAAACRLIENDEIDLMIVVAERNKVGEVDGWMHELLQHSHLTSLLYYGAPAKRDKARQIIPSCQAMVSTYETIKTDAAIFQKSKGKTNTRKTPQAGPLLEVIRGRRVLLVYDEISGKLANRSSGLYRAHHFLISQLRAGVRVRGLDRGSCRVIGLTGTPIERNPEGTFNYTRLLYPEIGSVEQFAKDHIQSYDIWGAPSKFKNISPEICDPKVISLSNKMAPIVSRKRKTDPDVRDQFPPQTEEFKYVELGKHHQSCYRQVHETFEGAGPLVERQVFGVMRLLAGHPLSLLHSEGEIASSIATTIGESGLRNLGSAKTDALVDYLTPLVLGQGAQVVVFSYYAQAILPYLQTALEGAGLSVVAHTGGMTHKAKEEAQRAFKAGEVSVFLSSDAGGRGINLPEATYVINYELPLKFSQYQQRIDRIHRVGHHIPVTAMSFIALNTVEEGIAKLVLRRNQWTDDISDSWNEPADDEVGIEDGSWHDGGHFITAEMRREIMRTGKDANKDKKVKA